MTLVALEAYTIDKIRPLGSSDGLGKSRGREPKQGSRFGPSTVPLCQKEAPTRAQGGSLAPCQAGTSIRSSTELTTACANTSHMSGPWWRGLSSYFCMPASKNSAIHRERIIDKYKAQPHHTEYSIKSLGRPHAMRRTIAAVDIPANERRVNQRPAKIKFHCPVPCRSRWVSRRSSK